MLGNCYTDYTATGISVSCDGGYYDCSVYESYIERLTLNSDGRSSRDHSLTLTPAGPAAATLNYYITLGTGT